MYVCKCTKMKKKNRFSDDDFIYCLNYLPTLNVSVFECENIKTLSGPLIVK